MSPPMSDKNVVVVAAAAFGVGLVAGCWTAATILQKTGQRKTTGADAEVIFFPDRRGSSRLLTNAKDAPHPGLGATREDLPRKRLESRLKKAKQSVDLCLFLFTDKSLGQILSKLVVKGVKVRLIIDEDGFDASSTQVPALLEHGAFVRICRSRSSTTSKGDASGPPPASSGAPAVTMMMHNKFAIIDGCQVLTGSLNWTYQGMTSNYENVVVSSDPELVQPFVKEFELLWKEQDPKTTTF